MQSGDRRLPDLVAALWSPISLRERAPAERRTVGRSWPRPSGSAMSAGSAPGAVPLSACGSILRTTNAHLRRTVVEMHVDAVPASARADHGDRDEDCAARPPNLPHGALLKCTLPQ